MPKTILLTLALLGSAFAQPTPDSQLTMDGQKVKLTQVYAYATEGFFDKSKDDTVVLLTDRAVPTAQVADTHALRKMAEDGKLSFVQETINAAGQIVNYTIGHRAFKALPSGGSTEHVFEGKRAGANISGKVFMRSPGKFFGNTFDYTAAFTSPVQPKK